MCVCVFVCVCVLYGTTFVILSMNKIHLILIYNN